MSTMRIGGLASGMDIDSIVEKLMQVEKMPLDKLEQKKQTYEWQRDAYRDVNKKLQTLDTYIADNLILKSLNAKTATSSNSEYVTATATGSATGTLSIEGVSQLATAARAVGNQVSAVGSTKISDFTEVGFIEIKAIQSNGEMAKTATKIEITSDMTVSEFVSKVNSSGAGVSMVFENGRFSMTAKNTGDNKAGDEIILSGNPDTISGLGFVRDGNGSVQTTDGKNAIFQVNGIATERSTNSFSISGYSVTLKNTFNSTTTIAEKYIAATKELELAIANEAMKNEALNGADPDNPTGAKFNYYQGTDSSKSYTDTHNSAYTDAFGKPAGTPEIIKTLTLSQQENYNKLGSSFFKELNDGEIDLIAGLKNETPEDLKTIVENNEKLNKLTDDQIEVLKGLSSSELSSFREQAIYSTYGTKLKEFYTLNHTITYEPEDDLKKIHDKIDDDTVFSDDLKKALKTLAEEDLKKLIDADTTTLARYEAKAEADDLKSKYNSLAGKLIYNPEDDSVSVGSLDEKQTEMWGSLSPEQQNAFKALAKQDQLRKSYIDAKTELEAAEIRLTNATDTFNTSQEDVRNAKIFEVETDADGKKITDADGNYIPKLDAKGNLIVDTQAIADSPKVNAVQLASTTNVDEMLNKIKEFVNTYNGLIKDLTNLTKESKYRDFPPLTSAQKKDMEENEIKLWEEKAKSGLLRGDSIIQNGLSSMRGLVYQTNTGVTNTKFNTLYNVGITTSRNYMEGGTLEIDENKLRKALEEDPDAVATLFSNTSGKVVKEGNTVVDDSRGYLQKLRDSFKDIQVNIEKRAGRSTMTQSQYTLGKNLNDVDKQIDSWQIKLQDIESRYWRQFGAMESMINKANNQSSMLMGQYF